MLVLILLQALGATLEPTEKPQPVAPEVALARVWISESGWSSEADQWGIYEVLSYRARSRDPKRIIATAKRYAGRTFPPHENPHKPPHRSERQRWVNEITASCDYPPSIAVWGLSTQLWRQVYRGKCKKLVARARAMLAGEYRPPCTAGTALHHWGGKMDDHRAIRVLSPVLVMCNGEESLNHFWCNPKLPGCYNDRAPACVNSAGKC